MRTKVIVLGAGITGVTTAWFLAKAGLDVTVIDRQTRPAEETSYANGGQISVSHAEPWANPHAPLKILKWLGKEDAPLLYKFQNDPNQWKWCLQFLRECTPGRTAKNIRDIVSLCEYSRQTLGDIRAETGIEYDQLTAGILHFYTSDREFEESLSAAALMRELGCPRQSVSKEEALRIEPSLYTIKDKIVGADFTNNDESGDVHKFTLELARKCRSKYGVRFLTETTVTKLITNHYGIEAVETIYEGHYFLEHADAFVVCMGSFSPQLVKPLGINLNIYPGKGYSATYDIIKPSKAPTVSLTDDEHKLVFSRLGDRLRVAGTCELNGYNRDLNRARCEAITRRTRELFPIVCDYSPESIQYWSGLRPLTPSNVPYIGKTEKYDNLFLNTGHGTLGWTMGCGSGKAISDIITKGKSEIELRSIQTSKSNIDSYVVANPWPR